MSIDPERYDSDPLKIERSIHKTQHHQSVQNRGITFRAFLIGLILMPINALWITVVEVRWYTLDGTCLPLFIEPVFFLFCICLANFAVRRAKPRLALDPGELLAIYVMLVMGTALAGHDLIQNLFGSIAHAYMFARPENGYKDHFFQYLKPSSFLIVTNMGAIKAFYQGGVSWTNPTYIAAFAGPLFWWAIFLGFLGGMCLSFNILIRKAWTENEKLAFPIVQLPLAMTNSDPTGTPFWHSPMMWGGFAIAGAIDIVNGLHYLYPSFPFLAWIKLYNVGQFFTQRPWNVISDTNISMYPFAIGIAYFLPLDLAFSCWFFFVARKLFQVLGAEMGWDAPSNVGFPFFQQQASGAWIALGCIIVWSLRGQFKTAWNTAFGSIPEMHGEKYEEFLSDRKRYRGAFLFIAAGVIFLSWFSNQIKLSAWVALLFFGLFFLIAFVITRVRAEFGSPHEIFFVNPRSIIVTLFGVNTIGAQSLTSLSPLYWYNRGYRNHLMPNQLEAFKMAENGKMQTNRLIALLAVSMVIGILCAYWANLKVTYMDGATSKCVGYKLWVGQEAYDQLNGWLQTPTHPDRTQIGYMIGGALFTIALRSMRSAFLWWPFHPAGYALAVSYAMDYFWFAFFISWVIKTLIIRFGGMKAHNAAIPMFLGLILGDFVFGSLWAIYGPLMHVQVYKIYI